MRVPTFIFACVGLITISSLQGMNGRSDDPYYDPQKGTRTLYVKQLPIPQQFSPLETTPRQFIPSSQVSYFIPQQFSAPIQTFLPQDVQNTFSQRHQSLTNVYEPQDAFTKKLGTAPKKFSLVTDFSGQVVTDLLGVLETLVVGGGTQAAFVAAFNQIVQDTIEWGGSQLVGQINNTTLTQITNLITAAFPTLNDPTIYNNPQQCQTLVTTLMSNICSAIVAGNNLSGTSATLLQTSFALVAPIFATTIPTAIASMTALQKAEAECLADCSSSKCWTSFKSCSCCKKQ